MKKTIRMRMTARRAEAHGFDVKTELAIRPVEVDLDKMSAAARWMAEHVTASYVADEHLDRCAIIAESAMSMAQRDRDRGVSEDRIRKLESMYGEEYTEKPMREKVSFPILSKQEPEDVFEEAAAKLIRAGAVRMICGSESMEIE